jgi:hypothetical protein
MQARQLQIGPVAVAFLSRRSKAKSLASLMPIARWRDDAIWFCENILRQEANLTEDEKNHYRHTLAMDARRILESHTDIRSSTIRIPDLATYRSLEAVSWSILGVPLLHHELFAWKKVGNTHRPQALSPGKVGTSLASDASSLPSVFAKLNIPREISLSGDREHSARERNPLSILAWVLATYYVLYGHS